MPNTHVTRDEEHACRLLAEHFAARGQSGFRCERSSLDPPDLLVRWDDGSDWGYRSNPYLPASCEARPNWRLRPVVHNAITKVDCLGRAYRTTTDLWGSTRTRNNMYS